MWVWVRVRVRVRQRGRGEEEEEAVSRIRLDGLVHDIGRISVYLWIYTSIYIYIYYDIVISGSLCEVFYVQRPLQIA